MLRGSLFGKYAAYFAALVTLALLVGGGIELHFSYNQNKADLLALQHEKALAAASHIEHYVQEIQHQLQWLGLLQTSADSAEQRRFDYLKVLRQVPAVADLSELDRNGIERLHLSRVGLNVTRGAQSFASDPKFTVPISGKVYFSPVYFRQETEPYMTISMAGTSDDAGIVVAEVNLKFILDVVSQIHVGQKGLAFAIDGDGRLIAHPDMSLVLQKLDLSSYPQVKSALGQDSGKSGRVNIARDTKGSEVLTDFAPIQSLGWFVFVEQPLQEAFAPLYSALKRTVLLLLAGIALSLLASVFLARRITRPIGTIQTGAARIAAGNLDQQIEVHTGDELEKLAAQFNDMAAELKQSYAGLERKVAERTHELGETNKQLIQAQEQIARLSLPSDEKLEDPQAWAAAMAQQVAHAIGVAEIGVWLFDADHVTPLAPGLTKQPDAVVLRRAGAGEFIRTHGSTIVTVAGMSGITCGALVIDGIADAFAETQRRLLTGLAQHLGTALELRSLRRQLSTAEANRAASKRELHERGIETLLLCPACGRCYPDNGKAHGPSRCGDDDRVLDGSRLLPFRINDRYRFEKLIGEGGMGTVFAAQDEKLDRDVALKIIKTTYLSDPAMRLRLSREARTVARIQHPAVTALFDTGELEDGSAFLVMELLRGRALACVLRDFGAGTPHQVACLLRQASTGLVAAHKAGVIHRDIKPENIFLAATAAGFQAKLLDFGIALPKQVDSRLTQTGVLIGTPAYMSPEQIIGAELDERTDLYSLAAVIWEALAGRPLVNENRMADVILSVLHNPVPPISNIAPGLNPDIDALFKAALAKARHDRPRDLEAWADSLSTILEQHESGPRHGWPSLQVHKAASAADTDAPTFI
jgi:HAMP domain-containing protein